MDKKRIIYISLLFIVIVLISVTYFSYAFFTGLSEQRGKIHIVTGELTYKIESSDLVNNSISINANESKQIEIKITSLNNINSKYELYYITSNNDIEIGYGRNNDTPNGIINTNATKTIYIVIKNKSNNTANLTFGVQGGFVDNLLVLEKGNSIVDIVNGLCSYQSGYVWNFSFDPDGNGKGQEQTFTVPCDGNYKLEVWGASGGKGYYSTYNAAGGKGGYSVGNLTLNTDNTLYINVGGKGQDGHMPSTIDSRTTSLGGYNGGGIGYSYYPSEDFGCGGGGGATHIALISGELKGLSSHATDGQILIVAAGGGGGSLSWYSKGYLSYIGGDGGGTVGLDGKSWSTSYVKGTGGTQSSGGTGNGKGSFGLGGIGSTAGGAGGGGGYYGGGGSGTWASAGGGSSYIGGVINGSTISGNSSMPTFDENSSMTGNEGNGYARITYLGE